MLDLFAASEAFQSGVASEQVLSNSHWKTYNTFTQYYLKDVAWADSELIYLGSGSGCSAEPPVAHLAGQICIYVYIVYSCIELHNKSDVLPLGGLFPGNELIPLFPYLRTGL